MLASPSLADAIADCRKHAVIPPLPCPTISTKIHGDQTWVKFQFHDLMEFVEVTPNIFIIWSTISFSCFSFLAFLVPIGQFDKLPMPFLHFPSVREQADHCQLRKIYILGVVLCKIEEMVEFKVRTMLVFVDCQQLHLVGHRIFSRL